jgi:predicted PurR-regulated permease PerM
MQIIGDIQNSYLLEINQYLNSFIEDVVSKFSTVGGEVLNTVVSQILRLTSSMIKFILSFVIAVYMLIDKNDLKIKIKRFNYAFFSIDLANRLVKITREANEIFSSFFIGKLIDSTIIGLLFYVLAITLGIPYAIINALIVGITNMIPYIGPFIGAIPVGIIVLVVSPYKFILTIVIIIALQQFDGLILGPLILGDRLNVSAFWIIVAVSIGGALKGFIGMLFGVPILVLLKTIVEETIEIKLESKQLNYIDGTQLEEKNNGYIFRRMYRSIKEYFEQ